MPLAHALSGLHREAAAVEQNGDQPAKAKSVLLVWLWGAPSHLDLFDPKPKAPAEYRGPFAPISTSTAGVLFSELLPMLATRSDRFSLIRSNINFNGDHFKGGRIAWTGAPRDGMRQVPPNFGSLLARYQGSADMPAFMSLASGRLGSTDGTLLDGYGGGPWGVAYDPFMVSCSSLGEVQVPALQLLDGLTPTRLTARRSLLNDLDTFRRRADTADFDRWHTVCQRAYTWLSSSGAMGAFDLSRESEATRAAYGQTEFGQSCLLGRRLVEAGVPYVQVNWSRTLEVHYPKSDYGWDTHADNFELLADWHGPLLDRVFSTLLDDLDQRGLLETTLVVCMGEFGRTPRINQIGSRDHWPKCYFSVWAGAGIQPGRVIGESDPRGEYPLTDPITPAMVGTTMLELAGVNTASRAELTVLEGGRLIDGLL